MSAMLQCDRCGKVSHGELRRKGKSFAVPTIKGWLCLQVPVPRLLCKACVSALVRFLELETQ